MMTLAQRNNIPIPHTEVDEIRSDYEFSSLRPRTMCDIRFTTVIDGIHRASQAGESKLGITFALIQQPRIWTA